MHLNPRLSRVLCTARAWALQTSAASPPNDVVCDDGDASPKAGDPGVFTLWGERERSTQAEQRDITLAAGITDPATRDTVIAAVVADFASAPQEAGGWLIQTTAPLARNTLTMDIKDWLDVDGSSKLMALAE